MATWYTPILKCALYICIFMSCYANICYHGDDKGFNGDSVYNKDYFCCDFYEKKGMACVECAVGYTSTKGEPCKPCSRKRYGYRCADKCRACTRCNHIHGCVHGSTIDSAQFTHLEYNATSVIEMFYTQTTAATVDKYEMFVYIVCIACAFLFGLVISGILFYKRMKDRTTVSQNMPVSTIQHPEENNIEIIYEEIDETTLPEPTQHANPYSINEEFNSTSSSSVDKDSMSNHEDQYLNPYQIIIQDVVERQYSVIERSNTELRNVASLTKVGGNHQHQEEFEEQGGHQKIPLVFRQAQSHSLNYAEIEIVNKRDTGNIGRYTNTQIFPRQMITNHSSAENTKYVEIVHIA